MIDYLIDNSCRLFWMTVFIFIIFFNVFRYLDSLPDDALVIRMKNTSIIIILISVIAMFVFLICCLV